MKILYLYAEIMGYQIPVLKQYVDEYNAEVDVVHWDHKKLTPYTPPNISGINYYKRSEYNLERLMDLATESKPDIVYVSGWMDKDYMSVCKFLKNRGVLIVAGSDTQWKGTLKQKLASFLFRFTYIKSFNYIWVAGAYQYEYAVRLGFKKNEIIFNSLSANSELFDKAIPFLLEKRKKYPQQFLYVGNFREIKGTDILLRAFRIYKEVYNGNWGLTCVGNGIYEETLKSEKGISVKSFSNQQDLVKITKNMGVFILPSRFDQWGLVVHEFAAAGMPMILSENVGAISTFFIDNFNGLRYHDNSAEELALTMHKISNKNTEELIKMGYNSSLLSKKISPRIVAASFMSILKKP